VTRVYDIRDLIIQVPDFDNPPQLGIHADGVSAASRPSTAPYRSNNSKTRQDLVHDVIVLITSSVDPLSWQGNTGTLGSVRELDGQLIITQTPANHERILSLLEQMRGPRSIQVNVETRFLSTSKAGETVLRRRGNAWTPVEGSNF